MYMYTSGIFYHWHYINTLGTLPVTGKVYYLITIEKINLSQSIQSEYFTIGTIRILTVIKHFLIGTEDHWKILCLLLQRFIQALFKLKFVHILNRVFGWIIFDWIMTLNNKKGCFCGILQNLQFTIFKWVFAEIFLYNHYLKLKLEQI